MTCDCSLNLQLLHGHDDKSSGPPALMIIPVNWSSAASPHWAPDSIHERAGAMETLTGEDYRWAGICHCIIGKERDQGPMAKEILCWGFPLVKLLMGCKNQFFLPFGSSEVTSDIAAALGHLAALGRKWVSWRGSSLENWGWGLKRLGWHQMTTQNSSNNGNKDCQKWWNCQNFHR